MLKEEIKSLPAVSAYLSHKRAVDKMSANMDKARAKKLTCRVPMKYIAQGGLGVIVGADVTAMQATCDKLLQISKEGGGLEKKYDTQCRKKQTAGK